MTDPVAAADDAFFAALLAADATALDALLAPDFAIIEVLAGQLVPREAFIGAVASGQLAFVGIEREAAEVSVRRREGLGVVVGRTRMTMRFEGAEASIDSRYTHVFVPDGDGGWRMLAAQGTRLAAA